MSLPDNNQLDRLIRQALTAGLRPAQPSPRVWLRVRRQIETLHSPRAFTFFEAAPRRRRLPQPTAQAASGLNIEALTFYAWRWIGEKAIHNLHMLA